MILRVKDNEGNIIPIPAIQGESAYDVAVNNGFEGTEEEWLDSLKGGASSERPTATIHCKTDTAYFVVDTSVTNFATATYQLEGDENPEVVDIINNNKEVKDISIVVLGETIPLSRVAEKDGKPFILTSDRPYFYHDSSLYYIVIFSAYYPKELGYLGTYASSIDDIIITYYTD